MWPEILSIIAVAISGSAAVCSACVPAIINAKNKKKELELKRELEREKLKHEKELELEAKFEVFYQEHLKILTDFSEYYVMWKNVRSENAKFELITFINKLSTQFRSSTQVKLNNFVAKIQNSVKGEDIDKDYKNCVNSILESYGIVLMFDFPDILLPDILKSALKMQFYKLQHLKVDAYNRICSL